MLPKSHRLTHGYRLQEEQEAIKRLRQLREGAQPKANLPLEALNRRSDLEGEETTPPTGNVDSDTPVENDGENLDQSQMDILEEADTAAEDTIMADTNDNAESAEENTTQAEGDTK